MIYTSGTSRILSLDEANSTDPVGWAVNTDYGHVLFNDNRTKAGWSGNTSNFSYGSGVTLDSNYCTMPVIASGSSDVLTVSVSYSNATDVLKINLNGKIPWFVTAAVLYGDFPTDKLENFNGVSTVHSQDRSFIFSYPRVVTTWSAMELQLTTVYSSNTWFPLIAGRSFTGYYKTPAFYYLRNSHIDSIWSPSSIPSGSYPLSPNCLRPITFRETMSTSGKAYSNVTNAVFKTALYGDLYSSDGVPAYPVTVISNAYLGDVYSEYPSGRTYFIGNSNKYYLPSDIYNVSSYVLLLYTKTVGSCTTPYSGNVSSPGTLVLTEGNYRGTAPILATASGESVITQTN